VNLACGLLLTAERAATLHLMSDTSDRTHSFNYFNSFSVNLSVLAVFLICMRYWLMIIQYHMVQEVASLKKNTNHQLETADKAIASEYVDKSIISLQAWSTADS